MKMGMMGKISIPVVVSISLIALIISLSPIVEQVFAQTEEKMDLDMMEKEKMDQDMMEKEKMEDNEGGGCLIATATFGSEFTPQVQMLREIRDNKVLLTNSGTSFMTAFNEFYYSFSPTIADWERQNAIFKEAVKITITPLLMSLSILNYVDIDSEGEMLGYGIGIIFLNIGMYFVAPAVVIIRLKKFILEFNFKIKNKFSFTLFNTLIKSFSR